MEIEGLVEEEEDVLEFGFEDSPRNRETNFMSKHNISFSTELAIALYRFESIVLVANFSAILLCFLSSFHISSLYTLLTSRCVFAFQAGNHESLYWPTRSSFHFIVRTCTKLGNAKNLILFIAFLEIQFQFQRFIIFSRHLLFLHLYFTSNFDINLLKYSN